MKKVLLGAALFVVLFIAGGAWWLYSSLDSLVASAIRTYAPEITGVSVQLSRASIKTAGGSAALHGLVVGNPKGFKLGHALSLGEVDLTLDINSLTKDVILIHEINIIKPDVAYEYASQGSNLEAIQRNISNYVATTSGRNNEAKDSGAGKKIIIERLYIRDGKVELSEEILKGKEITVPLPNLQLTDIGKKSNGATAAEVTKQILSAITQSATKAVSSVNFSGLATNAAKGAQNASSRLKGLFN